MKKSSFVCIILTTWNHWEDTAECLQSLYKNTYKNFAVVVVDNESTDKTQQEITKNYTHISLIRNKQKGTYTKSVNLGFKASIKKNADYSLLLNNDTKVDKNFLTTLVSRIESDQKIGIVAPKMYFYDFPNKIWYAGGTTDLKKGIIEHPCYGTIDNKGGHNIAKETGYCTGCCALFKNTMLKEIGLADEGFEMYMSDVEHSVRAQKYGYKTYFEPKSVIWQKVSLSTKKSDPYKERMKSRESVRFLYKESKLGAFRYSIRRIRTTTHLLRQYGFSHWLKVIGGLILGYSVAIKSSKVPFWQNK